MESFRYHDLGRIAYADALEYQTAAFEVLLDAKATGKKEDNQLFFCEHLPVLTIGKSGKDSNLLIPEETLRERGVSFYHINRGIRAVAPAVYRSLFRLCHGRILHAQGQARPYHLRRPVQARCRLPRPVAADPPSSGT